MTSQPVLPTAPTAEAWAAMSLAARESFLAEALAALQLQAELAPEGRPRAAARMGAATLLSDFYDRMGRAMFLGCDLPSRGVDLALEIRPRARARSSA